MNKADKLEKKTRDEKEDEVSWWLKLYLFKLLENMLKISKKSLEVYELHGRYKFSTDHVTSKKTQVWSFIQIFGNGTDLELFIFFLCYVFYTRTSDCFKFLVPIVDVLFNSCRIHETFFQMPFYNVLLNSIA